MIEIIERGRELEGLTRRNVSFLAEQIERNYESLKLPFEHMGYRAKIEDGRVFLVSKNKTIELQGDPDALRLLATFGKKEVIISYSDFEDEYFRCFSSNGVREIGIKESTPFLVGDSSVDKRKSSTSVSYVFDRNHRQVGSKITLFNPRSVDGEKYHSGLYVYESNLDSWRMSMFSNSGFLRPGSQNGNVVSHMVCPDRGSCTQLAVVKDGKRVESFNLTKKDSQWFADYDWTTFRPINVGEFANITDECRDYIYRLSIYPEFQQVMEGIPLIKKHIPGQLEALSKAGFLDPESDYIKKRTY
jgi:hypothetical protein